MAEQRSLKAGRGRPPADIDDAVADAVIRRLTSARSITLSVRDLAAQVGVHRSTIYRRWPTEHALLELALDRTATRLRSELRGDVGPDLLLERIAEFLSGRVGRALVRAQIALATARIHDVPPRDTPDRDRAPDPLLDLLVGATIHRLYVTGEPADSIWRDTVLAHIGATAPTRAHE